MNQFNVIVPLFNEVSEKQRIKNLIHKFNSHKIILCDAGSSDGTQEFLFEMKEAFPSISINIQNLPKPSVLKTVELGYKDCSHPHTIIHPVDIDLNKNLEIAELITIDKVVIFYKKYSPTNLLLRLQSIYLNRLDLRLRSNFVWTNAPIIKTHILKSFKPKTYGFLEDVQLSDFLKSRYKYQLIKSHILVSSRRYKANGTLFRFIKNAFIMASYRLGVLSIERLKSIYYR